MLGLLSGVTTLKLACLVFRNLTLQVGRLQVGQVFEKQVHSIYFCIPHFSFLSKIVAMRQKILKMTEGIGTSFSLINIRRFGAIQIYIHYDVCLTTPLGNIVMRICVRLSKILKMFKYFRSTLDTHLYAFNSRINFGLLSPPLDFKLTITKINSNSPY